MPEFQKGNTIGLATRFQPGNTIGARFKKGDNIGKKPWNFGLYTYIKTGYDRFRNGRKHCIVCEVYYDREQYSTFKNPFYCNDCGRKLRTVSRDRLNRVYI